MSSLEKALVDKKAELVGRDNQLSQNLEWLGKEIPRLQDMQRKMIREIDVVRETLKAVTSLGMSREKKEGKKEEKPAKKKAG